MGEKIVGYLGYNQKSKRFGILYMDCWEDDGLHCGECIEVCINNEWVEDRIEFSDNWYLYDSKLKGKELEGLPVKFEMR
jgi:hypothetical protein